MVAIYRLRADEINDAFLKNIQTLFFPLARTVRNENAKRKL